MSKNNGRGPYALFQSVAGDGTRWQFVILANDQWAITLNGTEVDAGPADRMGIGSGVARFLELSGDGETRKRRAPTSVLQTQHKGT